MSDVKYTPPAFPVPSPAHAYVVPPLVDGGGSGGGAPGTLAASALEFCVFTVDVRVGWPRSYPLHGLCDDATLASVDGLAVRAERKRAKQELKEDRLRKKKEKEEKEKMDKAAELERRQQVGWCG